MEERDDGLSAGQLGKLRRIFHRPILTSNDEEYSPARRVWNGMFDRRPSVIVRPTSIAEVMNVRFAGKRAWRRRYAAEATAWREVSGRRGDDDRPLADERGADRPEPADRAGAGRHDVGWIRSREREIWTGDYEGDFVDRRMG